MRLSYEGRLVSYEEFLGWLQERKAFVTEIVLSRCNISLPSLPTPKSLLLPQREELYHFLWGKREWKVVPLPPDSEKALLLLAPCEAKAVVHVLDEVFLQSAPPDSSYAVRRRNITLVVVGCTFFEATCFCTKVGGHPLSWEGGNCFVLPLPFGMYLEGEGPEGRPLEPSEKEELEKLAERLAKEALQPLPEKTPEYLYNAFEKGIWEEVTWGCFNCGACTFLCPTCFCFDLALEGKLRGAMIRTWDSCMFPKFTLHASSHNPRANPLQRVRQRVLHKFSYFPLRKGKFGCVGCGRCILTCPVNWDIREAVERVVSCAL